ncbi:MAG TPA: tetratricopeptide repeat protein [Polyangiaceae bacterium]|nr:tetratricopeptide repeat protein [Polyangiaceae bacterium]
MTRPTCDRVWQAEAIEDGRLDGPERMSFAKHARSCPVCAKEVAALGSVRETMQMVAALSSTPLEHRRARAELLRRADIRVLSRGSERLAGRWLWLAAAIACGAMAVVVVALISRQHQALSAADIFQGPPSFEVEGAEDAEWSSEIVGSVLRAHLDAGMASFHVERTQSGQRFLLHMPDGEIEVHGTRFRVEVRRGTTKRVEVSEGVVTLRLRDEPEHWLHAGEAWDVDEAIAARRDNVDAGTAAPVPSAAKSPTDARSTGAPEDAFAAAVTALRQGNYRKAEQMLDRFLAASPHDARLEDAWFMKAVARARSGDTEGAAELGRAYLERFPNGLRRREAQRIAAGHPTSGHP